MEEWWWISELAAGVVGALAVLGGTGLAHRLQEKREERDDRRRAYSTLLYRVSHLTLIERDDVPAIGRGKFLRDQRREMIQALSNAQLVCSKEVFDELSKVSDAMDSLDPERDGVKKWQEGVAKARPRLVKAMRNDLRAEDLGIAGSKDT